MSKERQNWLDSMSLQVDFHRRASRPSRRDQEFEWAHYERLQSRPRGLFRAAKGLLRKALPTPSARATPFSLGWLRENSSLVWQTRQMLADDLSRSLYDSALILRMTDHRSYSYPRIDFDDLIEFSEVGEFSISGFPKDYLGMPLGIFDVSFPGRTELPMAKVITRRIQLQLINHYRQYLIRRNGYDVSPRPGEVVFDCGACIGEVSVLFACMVAPAGEVHLFDPMPLHTRFCELQSSMNPHLSSVIRINTCAVGDRTHGGVGTQSDSGEITPGASVDTDDFPCTRLDDYADGIARPVDYIKMDIEGAEIAALDGAAGIIRECKPRMAVSGYHKPQDLWEIPLRLKELNPDYQITFGHHTPTVWESVFYAVDHGPRRTKAA